MSEQIATTSQTGSNNHRETQTLHPAEIDYVVRVFPVENPLDLKALQHRRIYEVWKVLVDHERQVMQEIEYISSTIMDDRYLIN